MFTHTATTGHIPHETDTLNAEHEHLLEGQKYIQNRTQIPRLLHDAHPPNNLN